MAQTFPESLGFRDGTASVHTSRTVMLGYLPLVLLAPGPPRGCPAF